MPNVSFFIDGFNVYHSIKEALNDGSITNGKWLDYRALCTSYLGLVGKDAQLASVNYFSAIATHIPDAAIRHRALIEVMKDQGINITLGNFKRKTITCRASGGCGLPFNTHEEKETDLNIGLSLVGSFHANSCDVAVIVSGDTDLLAAIRQAKTLFPLKRIFIAFPYKRFNNNFQSFVDQTIKIPAARYAQYQLPNLVPLSNGRTVSKPTGW